MFWRPPNVPLVDINGRVILRLMHVIYHLEVAELRFQVPLSEAALLDEASKQINLLSQKMLQSGLLSSPFMETERQKIVS